MTIIGLLVTLVIIGVVLYLVTLIPMNATIRQIIIVIALLFTILWLLEAFGIVGPWHINQRLR